MGKPDAENLMTTAEVDALFRVDPKTVARWAKDGKLKHIRLPGGHRRYLASHVQEVYRAGTVTREDS